MEVENQSSDSNHSRSDVSDGRRGSWRSNQKRRKLDLDFISRLPNTLILNILSLIPIEDAVSTTVLSKRWHDVWTCTPVLNISSFFGPRQDESFNLRDTKRYISTINRALLLYQSPKIEKLNIVIMYLSSFSHEIDAWLLFALRRNVQELQLYLKDTSPYEFDHVNEDEHGEASPYVLPPFLLKSSSLVTLKISKCQFDGHKLIKWNSLKDLVLKYMSLTNDLLRDIISGCPSLESLKLSYCHGFDYVESKSLQHLVVNNYNYIERFESVLRLRISAPSLRSMKISGNMRAQRIHLPYTSASLAEAKVCFTLGIDEGTLEISGQMFSKSLRGILEKLRYVKYLTIGSWCLQILSRVADAIPPFSNLGCLTLQTRLKPFDHPGITRMLGLTPHLDTLVINIDSNGSSSWLDPEDGLDKSNAEHWVSRKGSIQATLQNLRTVKIVDITGSEDEMEFIAFMLNNTQRLEKMIIQRRKPDWHPNTAGSLNIAERLLSFPRCSSAIVLFYEIPKKNI